MVEAKKALHLVQDKLVSWSEAFIVMLPNMASAALILVVSWSLARFVRSVANRLVIRYFQSGTLQRLFTGGCM